MTMISTRRPLTLAAVSTLAALATFSCGGSATPLSPSSTGRASTPSGAFSLATSRTIHALEEFPATPGATVAAPCTPLTPASTTPAQTTGTGAGADAGAAAPAVPPSNYYAPYSVRTGSIRSLADETAPAAATPAVPCATVQILIVGTIGSQAFSPNPGAANVGDSLVWTNNDLRPHKIVIDDGTPTGTALGVIGPGETSTAFTLSGASAAYHCEFHPSMVGTINARLSDSTSTSTSGATTTNTDTTDAAPMPDSGYGYYRLKSK